MRYNFHQKRFEPSSQPATHPAVVGSEKTLTWEELQTEIESLAEILSKMKIPHGAPVIIYGHKEARYLIAIMACIHSSVTYIPVDVIYPAERIAKVASIANVQIMINCTGGSVDMNFPCVIEYDNSIRQSQPLNFTVEATIPEQDLLQYIMFTSGSTGEPKGVQITRNSTLSYIDWTTSEFGFTDKDVFMNQSPFTFDVSLGDLFHAMSLGGTVVLNSTAIAKDQNLFIERIGTTGCTVWMSTPSFTYLFLRHPQFNSNNLPDLNTFVLMGEELQPRICQQLRKLFPRARIMNGYGPTEATIITTLVTITDEMLSQQSVLPIGYAMTGSDLFIENPAGDRGEGELVISGPHVSTGYFKRPELNAQKFFIHNGHRAFRSGDLAYKENGMFYYLGRNDDQVKLHGFRIEMHEISNVLLSFDEVTDAVTVALKRNNEVKKLISFVILSRGISNPNEYFRDSLQKKLPYYMIPGDIVAVSEFPYSVSHKVDRNKLIEHYIAMNTQ